MAAWESRELSDPQFPHRVKSGIDNSPFFTGLSKEQAGATSCLAHTKFSTSGSRAAVIEVVII